MNLNELLKLKARKNPDSLLKLLVATALVSFFAVVIVSSFSFFRIFSGFVIKNAENNSVQLCKVLIDQQKDLMFVTVPGKGTELGLHGTEMFDFDLSLRHYLVPFDIIKVKVYNTRKEIIFCTDPMLIGKVDEHNLHLKNALDGRVDSRMVKKEMAHDLDDEKLLDVDVVETYVPILSPDRKVLGSFEVYMNITSYREKIQKGAEVMTALLALALTGVFGLSYLLVRGGVDQLKEVQAQLEFIAITDALTGIYNRGYLMKRGEEEFERVLRRTGDQRTSLGCIMIDLDHFKMVNDTKGHIVGDGVLKGVAERLRKSVRPYDIVGRYGGEEFVVLLPDTAFGQSLAVAQRICELVRNELFEVDGVCLPVTISLGVAHFSADDRVLSDMIKRADEGLYKAKNDGRDRVAWVGHTGNHDAAM